MKDERYKEIMQSLGQPNSRSLLVALEQVANEVEQEVHAQYKGAKELTQQKDIQSIITEILDMWYSSDAQDHDYQEKNMECPTCALIRLRHVLKNKT